MALSAFPARRPPDPGGFVTKIIKPLADTAILKMKTSKLFLGAAALLLGTALSHAAILTSVPMQGGMAMPMVSYNAAAGRLHVMMPPEIPQLTPLLVSNPSDSFDPADPWFDALDPSRQGASFSRRYGFVMDAASDPLPAGTQMWIRKLSGPPELGVYRYSGSAPKALEPTFGTAGTTNARAWNGMMFHPVFSAPPGTNDLTATFDLYLFDTTTGQEVANSDSGPLEFTWTNVPDGRPALSTSQRIVIAWPSATTANWVLESVNPLNATSWSVVTNAPVTVDGQPCVVLHGVAAQQYFRMRYVP